VGDRRTLHQKVVRSHDNGWIFAHNNLHLPAEADATMREAAIGAVRSLGLDFGAVDILARFKGNRLEACAVCEVNTAPGVENTKTLDAYVKAITEVYNNKGR